MRTGLARADWEEYLIRLYFGSGSDYLTLALDRAYLDFNRTLHGMGGLRARDELYAEARAALRAAIASVGSGTTTIGCMREFDEWHADQCRRLAAIASSHGYPSFYVGQAQKWINMTLKCIFAMGEDRMPGFSPVYSWCHVPLDNIVLGRLAPYGFAGLGCSWSRLSDYDEYMSCQNWFRRTFDSVPLDIEFRLWNGEAVPLRSREHTEP